MLTVLMLDIVDILYICRFFSVMLEIFYRSLCRMAKYSCITENLETHKITHLSIFCIVKKKLLK